MKPVFLVDDSPTMLASLAGVLTKAQIPVEKADSAEAALSRLRGGTLALRLVVTDYHMPGMNGVELVREIRRIPAYRFLPILLLTTESEQSRREAARAAGATGWLVKPIEPARLMQVLQQVAPA